MNISGQKVEVCIISLKPYSWLNLKKHIELLIFLKKIRRYKCANIIIIIISLANWPERMKTTFDICIGRKTARQ